MCNLNAILNEQDQFKSTTSTSTSTSTTSIDSIALKEFELTHFNFLSLHIEFEEALVGECSPETNVHELTMQVLLNDINCLSKLSDKLNHRHNEIENKHLADFQLETDVSVGELAQKCLEIRLKFARRVVDILRSEVDELVGPKAQILVRQSRIAELDSICAKKASQLAQVDRLEPTERLFFAQLHCKLEKLLFSAHFENSDRRMAEVVQWKSIVDELPIVAIDVALQTVFNSSNLDLNLRMAVDVCFASIREKFELIDEPLDSARLAHYLLGE